jgi:hypothetical protein
MEHLLSTHVSRQMVFSISFFNSANIAIRQANNKHLHEYTQYVIENSHLLQSKKTVYNFLNTKFLKQELLLFNTFTMLVSNLVNRAKPFFKNQTNNPNGAPFICVAHDGWDSKGRDILGVSIHFVIHNNWEYLSMAVGLQRMNSKRSVDTVERINRILLR